jgi:hypothetical protein
MFMRRYRNVIPELPLPVSPVKGSPDYGGDPVKPVELSGKGAMGKKKPMARTNSCRYIPMNFHGLSHQKPEPFPALYRKAKESGFA